MLQRSVCVWQRERCQADPNKASRSLFAAAGPAVGDGIANLFAALYSYGTSEMQENVALDRRNAGTKFLRSRTTFSTFNDS